MIILIDTREKRNEHITKQFDKMKIPYVSQKLDFGDYSFELDGESFENKIVIERKGSLDEIASNFTVGRIRFRKEFERARSKNCIMHVVIENASWQKIIDGDYRSRFSPSAFQGSLTTWAYKYQYKLDFVPKNDMACFILNTFQKYIGGLFA